MAAIFRDHDGKGPDHSRRGSFLEKSNPLVLRDRKKAEKWRIETLQEKYFIYFAVECIYSVHTNLGLHFSVDQDSV